MMRKLDDVVQGVSENHETESETDLTGAEDEESVAAVTEGKDEGGEDDSPE